ncbi:MAG: DUF2934 domain-containing protein [Devosia sp.]|uniref:DUF2934 domain-containing protein n=2 Tax=Devosia sp. TaxID=1871048 RepID=UPI001AD3C40B|nr:DUF2934 domain-containing protein [Devosia sp.]MBN9316657.1 DUF2934 domain-containing protein [Devosia sp.]
MPAKSVPTAPRPADPAAIVSEEAIRQRAYFMWEADGSPEGRQDHYWSLARAEAIRAFVEATANGVARAAAATPEAKPTRQSAAKAK